MVFLEADVGVITMEVGYHCCFVFGTHRLWNMFSPSAAVTAVQEVERYSEKPVLKKRCEQTTLVWLQ
jgi:hypothetical protein